MSVERVLFDKCLAELSGLIEATEDRVAVYRLCAACEKERFYLGVGDKAARIGEEEVFIV